MENYRIFVEKHPRFRVEADSLRRELNTNLNLDIRSLQLLNVYDLFGFSRELLEKSRYSVFGEGPLVSTRWPRLPRSLTVITAAVYAIIMFSCFLNWFLSYSTGAGAVKNKWG